MLKHRWSNEGGYREVLKIAVPLIMSTGAWSIHHFVDRMFLAWYSPEALAAAMPAGMVNFTFMAFFIGTAGYVSTFVAQYHGAKRNDRIGPAAWQGIYFAGLAGGLLLCMIPLAERIFSLAGHEPAVRQLEVEYFRILCLGAVPSVISAAISGFFSGRGKTWVVMWVTMVATGTNVVLDYALIFGVWGFPEWGIRGAALATVIGSCISATLFLVLMTRPHCQEEFSTRSGWRPDGDLFRRLLRYGLPSGIHFMLDILGFTLFIMVVGRLGTVHLAATNIAFNINTLAFMPMIGFSTAAAILVGQRLGEDRPDLAAYSTWSVLHLTSIYMGSIAFCYVVFPKLFILPFGVRANPEDFAALSHTVTVLLRFVALYSLFDTMCLVFSGALRGAGDTRFVMVVSVVISWMVMVIPSYVAIIVFGKGLYVAWAFGTAYISLMGIVFLTRFLGGKWRSMRVIEQAPSEEEAGRQGDAVTR